MPGTDRFREALARGPILLDAAMGTRLIAMGLDLATDDPSAWVLDHPERVLEIHRRDVEAGSDAVLTNTFGANRVWLERIGRAHLAPEMNRLAARLARLASGPERLVLGSIGPTSSGDPDALREQADALIEGGVDALILETHRLDQALAALRELTRLSSLPILASLYLWDQPIERGVKALEAAGAEVLGVNCVSGLDEASRVVEALRHYTDLPLLAKPSPDQGSPEQFARTISEWITLNVRLIGGCCGSDETHLTMMRRCLPDALRPGSPWHCDPLRLSSEDRNP